MSTNRQHCIASLKALVVLNKQQGIEVIKRIAEVL